MFFRIFRKIKKWLPRISSTSLSLCFGLRRYHPSLVGLINKKIHFQNILLRMFFLLPTFITNIFDNVLYCWRILHQPLIMFQGKGLKCATCFNGTFDDNDYGYYTINNPCRVYRGHTSSCLRRISRNYMHVFTSTEVTFQGAQNVNRNFDF